MEMAFTKIKILKGTNQIGGCITEISSKEAKIIIDFGSNLQDINSEISEETPLIDGLTSGIKSYDAVFITHNHNDHIGMISHVMPEIPVYVEKTSKKIYDILNDFTKLELKHNTIDMIAENSVIIKDIRVTPYIVDHSAYNSLMLLIESNGKKILHTGDFRNHGYKGRFLNETLQKIGKIDVLVTEGTSFSRKEIINKTEKKLSEESIKVMKKYNQVFVLQSGTNIDRITTMYKAAIKTNKIFVEDIFIANIAILTKPSIPNPITFDHVYTYVPQNRYLSKDKDFIKKYVEPFNQKNAISKIFYNDYVMNVRTSMISDLKKFKEKGLINNACLIYSMWEGYKKKTEFKSFLDKVSELGIDIVDLHTSGHADILAIKKVIEQLRPSIVIPIHTINKLKIKELFNNSVILEDNEEIEI